jgi:tetratricopeptide (TPR) repeat protein
MFFARLQSIFRSAARLTESKCFAFPVFLLACLVAYAPALNGELLWDDIYLVGENPFFKSPAFVFEVFRHWLYLDSLSLYYRPVQNLSYILDYWLWNRNPVGYHLSNVLLHTTSGFLLYLLLRKILPSLLSSKEKTGKSAIAFLVSLIWIIHPIQNAAVAYVAGRADSLATLFAVGGWLLYLQHKPGKLRAACYCIAPFLFLIALCSKEIAFIWIGLFTVYLFAFDKELKLQAKIVSIVSLLAVFVCYLWLRHLPEARATQTAGSEDFVFRVILMLRALGDYASLAFFPDQLHMERIVFTSVAYRNVDLWQRSIRFEYLSSIGMLTLAGASYAAWSKRPGQRLRIFGIAWFALGFLPISNLFPLNAQVAEHWIYMASFGFLLIIAGCIVALPKQHAWVAAAIVCLATFGLTIRTSFRAEEWSSAETFFRQTIASGGSSARVNLNLAHIYSGHGDYVKAEKVLRDALERFPDHPNIKINLGINLLKQGRTQEAEAFLQFDNAASKTMVGMYPHTWSAALNVAHLRYQEGKYDESLAILEDAISRYPDTWELVQFKAQVVEHEYGAVRAIPVVDKYASARWWHYDSHLLLGQMRLEAGDLDGAIADFERAAKLDVHATEPLERIARINVMQNKMDMALAAQKKAIGRGLQQPNQYLMLAAILSQMNRKEEALDAFQKAQDLRAAAQTPAKVL